MKELSLHILDVAQNSTNAQATEIRIEILEDLFANVFRITISDNGCGISEERLNAITNPFTTSRTTRRVGLGLPLLQAAAEQCNGTMTIESAEEQGTTVRATFEHDHIDRQPLGDIVSTLIGLMTGHPAIDFVYHHQVNDRGFTLRTQDIKQELDDMPISDMSVVNFLTEYIQENIHSLYEEANV
ncbi:ATP-binding protein [candidate division KSB3 bacterium]|uniref:ATP-binding protein n=1 Tax=candidate division KSB3 bacterium TaxID=2044937 RepID=A0A2G6KER6_9BACT|nr:MAG: ATP-binding protein [candidate division KSB3 bacterium]